MEVAPMVRLDMEGRPVVVHLVVMHGPEKRGHEEYGHEGGQSRVS